MKTLPATLGAAALGLLPAFPALHALAAQPGAQPNILIITTDQQSWTSLKTTIEN